MVSEEKTYLLRLVIMYGYTTMHENGESIFKSGTDFGSASPLIQAFNYKFI